jgi:hypothetical protein
MNKVYVIEAWLKISAPLIGLLCYGGFAEYDLNRVRVAHQASAVGLNHAIVDLSSTFNHSGIWTDGSTLSAGQGIDGNGFDALSATLLGPFQVFNHATFNFGPPNASNLISCTGQTITLPSGSFSSLRLLGFGINVLTQASQAFRVDYTDGTHDTFSQGITNFQIRATFSGETDAVSMPFLNKFDGTKLIFSVYIHEYEFAVNPAKTVASFSLPNNTNVQVMAITLVNPDLIAAPLFDGLSLTVGNTWEYFSAEIGGNGGTNPSDFQFNSSAAFIRLAFLLNWQSGGTAHQVELCGIRISEVAAGSFRAMKAFDPTSQLMGTFRNNPVNSNGILTGSNPISQAGTTTTINISACSIQYGDGQVNYNSGSVNPGSYGTWAIYCIDPKFGGGAVIYQATQSMHIKTSANGLILLGTITTLSGGGASGTGGGAGSADLSGGDASLPSR